MSSSEKPRSNPEINPQVAEFFTDMFALSWKGEVDKNGKDIKSIASYHLKDGRILTTSYIKEGSLSIAQACVWDIMKFGSIIAFPAEIFTAFKKKNGTSTVIIPSLKYNAEVNYDFFDDNEEKNARSAKQVKEFASKWDKKLELGEESNIRNLAKEAKSLPAFGPIEWFLPETEINIGESGEYEILVETTLYDPPEEPDPEEIRKASLKEFYVSVAGLVMAGKKEKVSGGIKHTAGYHLEDGRILYVEYWTNNELITTQASIVDFSLQEGCLLIPRENYSAIFLNKGNGVTNQINLLSRDIQIIFDLEWQLLSDPEYLQDKPPVAIKAQGKIDSKNKDRARKELLSILSGLDPKTTDRIAPNSDFLIEHDISRLNSLKSVKPI